MRTWLARSSSTSAASPLCRPPGGGRRRQLLQPLLLRGELARHLLVAAVELVAHLDQLVAELRRQLLQPEAEPLVVLELPGVESVDPLGQAADQVLDVGQRGAW